MCNEMSFRHFDAIMDVFVMDEDLPDSPVDIEDGFGFESGKEDTISVQVSQLVYNNYTTH